MRISPFALVRTLTLLAVGLISWAPESPADPPPTLRIDDAWMKEGDSGSRAMEFTVRLSEPTDSTVMVEVQTVNGTASAATADFDPLDADELVLYIPPGSVTATFGVSIYGDAVLEGNEWFHIRLRNPVGATIADGEAIGRIANDERASFVPIAGAVPPYTHGTLPSALGDYDGDGRLDIPLYRSTGPGTFSEIPGFRALLNAGNYHGAAWCDYDRDGGLDVVILGYAGQTFTMPTPTVLLRNIGPGGFFNVAPSQGMNIVGCGETAVWGDFDGDEWPDLFAPYYSHIYPYQSFLYHNNGDGTFTERAAAAGVSLPGVNVALRPEGAMAADWNEDGHLDLYCAGHLFLNIGWGDFVDIRQAVGLPVMFDEGAAFVDYDNDGDLDLYLRGNDGPRLFRNDQGEYTDVTSAVGLTPMALLWGDSWADVDGDGDSDLMLVLPSGHARLYLNQGNGTFEIDAIFEEQQVPGDLPAWGDLDGDGDVDFVVGAGYTRQVYLNQLDQQPGYEGSHLSVRVLDSGGHQSVHGATVRLRQIGGPPGTTQTGVVGGGAAYLTQNDYVVHFGGLGSGRYALEVVYPSPVGSRIVVDSLSNSAMGPIQPGALLGHAYTILRSGEVEITGSPVADAGSPTMRGSRLLGIPSPTPASRSVTLPVTLADATGATLTVHDLRGRRVRRLESGGVSTTARGFQWDLRDDRGSPVEAGVYFCRLVIDGRPADVRRVLVVR